MKKNLRKSAKPSVVPNVKSKITISELNSEVFSFDEQMLYQPSSKLNDLKHWWEDVRANTYRWYNAHPIAIYSLKRILYGLITLIVAVCIIALLVHSQIDEVIFNPIDYDKMHLTEDQLRQLREARMLEFGYSRNAGIFLGNFLYNLMPFIPKWSVVWEVWGVRVENGENVPYLVEQVRQLVLVDLGRTVRATVAPEGTLVTTIFANAIPYSFAFGALSVVISFLVGIPLGIEAAKRKAKAADNIINGFSLFIAAVPALIITLGIYILAIMGFGTSSLFSTGSFWSKFFPFLTLLFFTMPPIIIMTRRYVIDEMTADYTKFAYSQGFSINKVYYIYIFRNAGIKVLRDFPEQFFATLFGASMLVETQWGIPGMSSIVVGATSGASDPYIIMGYVSFTAFIQIFSSLLADMIVVGMDPRVSLGRK